MNGPLLYKIRIVVVLLSLLYAQINVKPGRGRLSKGVEIGKCVHPHPGVFVLKCDPLKGELNPKIKFVLFERTLKITE